MPDSSIVPSLSHLHFFILPCHGLASLLKFTGHFFLSSILVRKHGGQWKLLIRRCLTVESDNIVRDTFLEIAGVKCSTFTEVATDSCIT